MRFTRLAMVMASGCLGATGQAAEALHIAVDPETVERTIDLGRLTGGNIALWYDPATLASVELGAQFDRWKPGLLRMPGGSWSDEFFWNGNGVRKGDRFDTSKLRDGCWEVDYSDYAPGFHLASVDGKLSDYHGSVDVRALHEFIRKQGAETIVTVNAGTGTPEMAAEWVRWANKINKYNARYWEIGNELDGEWELGHFGRDGKPVDADEYARRFLAFAKAMKAVDPTIKVGGPACSNDKLSFVETLIRKAGAQLDFVSFHTYPVLASKRTGASQFAQAADVGNAAGRIRGWIRKYHPERVGRIEIGVTEWHKQVMETRSSVDLDSGLWACLFVGALVEAGVDFANQWDCFSTTASGGHGLFGRGGPRAAFHALTLWREHMHSEWLAVDGGDAALHAFATRKGEELAVMLVNTSRMSRHAILRIGGEPAKGFSEAFRLSQSEYLWNPHANAPEWSPGVAETRVAFHPDGGVNVPPSSALVVKLPLGKAADADYVSLKPGDPELGLLLPDEAPADLPVEGIVVVRTKGRSTPWPGLMPEATLSVDTAAQLDRTVVDLRESAGRFMLQPTGSGTSIVRAAALGLTTTHRIRWTEVTERKQVVWTFPDAASVSGLETTYQLTTDRQARPNQSVAAVRLARAAAKPQHNTLLAINHIPGDVPKKSIGGLCGLLGASADLRCDDPRASVEVVAQSNHDHWILLKRIPLKDLRGGWKELKLRITDPARLSAMTELYAVRLQLKSDAPVTGRIYADDLGFLIRSSER